LGLTALLKIDLLLDLALAGKLLMPANIQFVEAGSLGSNAFGAYDSSNGGSLYLDRSLLSEPAKLQAVFNEEMTEGVSDKVNFPTLNRVKLKNTLTTN